MSSFHTEVCALVRQKKDDPPQPPRSGENDKDAYTDQLADYERHIEGLRKEAAREVEAKGACGGWTAQLYDRAYTSFLRDTTRGDVVFSTESLVSPSTGVQPFNSPSPSSRRQLKRKQEQQHKDELAERKLQIMTTLTGLLETSAAAAGGPGRPSAVPQFRDLQSVMFLSL